MKGVGAEKRACPAAQRFRVRPEARTAERVGRAWVDESVDRVGTWVPKSEIRRDGELPGAPGIQTDERGGGPVATTTKKRIQAAPARRSLRALPTTARKVEQPVRVSSACGGGTLKDWAASMVADAPSISDEAFDLIASTLRAAGVTERGEARRAA